MIMTEIYSQHALPVGTMVQEYRIIEILGIGSFGIVYKAENKYFSEFVALKEFLPTELAHRQASATSVQPNSSESAKAFDYALHKFLQEAKTLRELGHPQQHPNIVRVRQFIETNDTAYMVMDFERGRPLSKILEKRGSLPEAEIRGILDALLDGLMRVHGASVWHRDIKPSNILIRHDGSPVLIDFGAARKDISGSDRSMMAIFSPAYAALEQIQPVNDQGPWTDIYALGATLYHAVTGHAPTNVAKRLQGVIYDPAVDVAKGQYSATFLAAIDAALKLYPEDRPQSIAQWKEMLLIAADDTPEDKTVLRPFSEDSPRPARIKKHKRLSPYQVPLVAMAVLLIAGLGWWVYRDRQAQHKPSTSVKTAEIEKKFEEEEIDSKTQQPSPTNLIESPSPVEAPAPLAQLKIESVPAAAQVYIDGVLKNKTPLTADVDKGTHSLRLSLEDYYTWELDILVEEKGDIPIRIPLLKKRE